MVDEKKSCKDCQHIDEGDGWSDAKECADCKNAGGHYDHWTEKKKDAAPEANS
ncbi:MAG: hypothetical protein WCK39_03380 [Methanomassiliicoccales archaeon]